MTERRPPPRGAALKRAVNSALDFYNIPPEIRNEVKPKRERRATAAPKASEHAEQKAVVDWWARAHHVYRLPVFALYCVPNGAHLAGSYIAAAKLKSEGMRPGIPDLFLAARRGPYAGLALEMKAGSNKPSDEQNAVLTYLERAGYKCAVCWSAASAIREIMCYLALGPGKALAHSVSLPA